MSDLLVGTPSPRASRPEPWRRWATLALAIVATALLGLSGCGYSSRRLVDQPGVSTIAVAQFDNKTYRRDLEFRLTKTLAEELRARTPWRMASVKTADAVLGGTIRYAEEHVLQERTDQARSPILKRFTIAADCELVERATGKTLRRYSVAARQDFAPDQFGETLDGSATDTILLTLAERIVAGLETPIGDPSAIPPRDVKRAIPPRYSQTDPATRPPPPPDPSAPRATPTR